jgi:hypothetical protein
LEIEVVDPVRQVVDQLVRSLHRSGVDPEEGDAGAGVG